jgi:hypothetical protein
MRAVPGRLVDPPRWQPEASMVDDPKLFAPHAPSAAGDGA